MRGRRSSKLQTVARAAVLLAALAARAEGPPSSAPPAAVETAPAPPAGLMQLLAQKGLHDL